MRRAPRCRSESPARSRPAASASPERAAAAAARTSPARGTRPVVHRHAQRLRQHREVLEAHLLVEQREAMEVEGVVVLARARRRAGRGWSRATRPGTAGSPAGPARPSAARPRRRRPGHRGRVVQRVGVGQDRGQPRMPRIGGLAAPALHVAGDPVLLEPADPAERPERRIEVLRRAPAAVRRPGARTVARRRLEQRRPAPGSGCGHRSGRATSGWLAPARWREARAVKAGRLGELRGTARARGGCDARPSGRVERQVARGHVGLVEARGRHLVRRLALPHTQVIGTIVESSIDAGTQAQHLARIATLARLPKVTWIAPDSMATELMYSLTILSTTASRPRRCRPASSPASPTRRATVGLTIRSSLADSTIGRGSILSEHAGPRSTRARR